MQNPKESILFNLNDLAISIENLFAKTKSNLSFGFKI